MQESWLFFRWLFDALRILATASRACLGRSSVTQALDGQRQDKMQLTILQPCLVFDHFIDGIAALEKQRHDFAGSIFGMFHVVDFGCLLVEVGKSVGGARCFTARWRVQYFFPTHQNQRPRENQAQSL